MAKFKEEVAKLLRVTLARVKQAEQRDEEVLRLREELARAKEQLANERTERELLLTRSRQLEQRVRELEAERARRDADPRQAQPAREPDRRNPPAAFVK